MKTKERAVEQKQRSADNALSGVHECTSRSRQTKHKRSEAKAHGAALSCQASRGVWRGGEGRSDMGAPSPSLTFK